MAQDKESSAPLVMELSALLKDEWFRQAAAAKFAEFTTAAELRAVFGMAHHTLIRMKRAGLRPVNSGTKVEVFRVADIKEHFERPEETALPSRRKRKVKAK